MNKRVEKEVRCGIRGCSGRTNRRGVERYCAQEWVVLDSKNSDYRYCYYHNPKDPKKFGEGYGTRRRNDERED